jgi:hypothetical protein
MLQVAVARAVVAVFLTYLYGAIAIQVSPIIFDAQGFDLNLFDIRAALIMSGLFMGLSGYGLTLFLLYMLLGEFWHWTAICALNVLLFFGHTAIIFSWLNDGTMGNDDLPMFLLGVVAVVAASGTTRLLFRKAGSRRTITRSA